MAAAGGGPRGDLRTSKALMGRLPEAMRVATRCSTVLGDATFRLQQGEAQSIELLTLLLSAIETEPERRTQQPTLFGPRELERCEYLLSPSEGTLQSAAFQQLCVKARVGRLSEHAARLRIAIPTHHSTALVAPAPSKSKDADGGETAANKVCVPLGV